MLSFIRSVVNKLLNPLGLKLVRASSAKDALSWDSAFTRLLTNGKEISTVIDVGASNGSWTKQVRAFLPEAFYLLIEANKVREIDLAAFKAHTPKIDYVIAAAGDTIGEINFDATDPCGGVATHLSLEEYNTYNLQSSVCTRKDDFKRIPVTTIDTLVEKMKLRPPFFLKLDVHGFEVPILKGAESTLGQTNLIQIECYNFPLTRDSLKFHEMVTYLETRGFRVIDLCDPVHRPVDHAFWQLDLFFIPANGDQFRINSYLCGKAAD